jgi:hypothetical protein
MWFRKALWAASFFSIISLFTPASRAQGEYLDVYIAKVKPEKVGAAEAIMKKMAEANRRNHGDNFVVLDTLYGEIGTYYFVSTRQDYGDIEKGNDVFMGALVKTLGQAGAEKLEADFLACVTSARTELRRRRPDLSRKMPADGAAYAKLIGTARVLRSSVIHVRPGHGPEFDAWLKEAKEYGDKNAEAQTLLISQVTEGGPGGTYYLSAPRTSLGGFDKNPTLKDMVGEENFTRMQKILGNVVEGSESMILHYRPDLSNAPQAINDVAPDFWTPKPAAPEKPKSKSATSDAAKPATKP